MSNPLYKALSGNQPNMTNDFWQFVNQMKGINPNEEIAKYIKSGHFTQDQLTHVQQIYNANMHQFHSMFGLRKR